MKRVATVMVLLLFAGGLAVCADEALDSALALIPDDGDVAVLYDDAGRATLEAAIRTLEDAVGVTVSFDATDEDDYMALEIPVEMKSIVNKLSQAYYTLGDVFLHGDDQAAQAAFVKGQFWGLKSLRMDPRFAEVERNSKSFVEAVKLATDVPALYWTYGNWARKDEFDVLGAVFRNDPPKLVVLMERALELDPAYVSYGAYRSLAAFWGGLPSLPLIAYGQDLPKALSYICPVLIEPQYCSNCSACPIDPSVNAYFENRLIFAQYYLMEKGLWADAARVLQSILDEPIGDLHALYNAFDQKLAAELLADVQKHL
jgi:hypothetical protein